MDVINIGHIFVLYTPLLSTPHPSPPYGANISKGMDSGISFNVRQSWAVQQELSEIFHMPWSCYITVLHHLLKNQLRSDDCKLLLRKGAEVL